MAKFISYIIFSFSFVLCAGDYNEFIKIYSCRDCAEVRTLQEGYARCGFCGSEAVLLEDNSCLNCMRQGNIVKQAPMCKPICNNPDDPSCKPKHEVEHHLACNIIKKCFSNDKRDCPICFMPSDLVVPCPTDPNVEHCAECFHMHTTISQERIGLNDEREIVFPCPCRDADCEGFSGRLNLKAILFSGPDGVETYNRIDNRLATTADENRGLIYCPLDSCTGMLYIETEDRALPYIICEHSQPAHNVCPKCEQIFNDPHTCSTSPEVSGQPMAYGDDFKPCPNPDCTINIVKNGGCSMMVCGGSYDNMRSNQRGSGCGARFCWHCGKYKLFGTAQWLLPNSSTETNHLPGYYMEDDPNHENTDWFDRSELVALQELAQPEPIIEEVDYSSGDEPVEVELNEDNAGLGLYEELLMAELRREGFTGTADQFRIMLNNADQLGMQLIDYYRMMNN